MVTYHCSSNPVSGLNESFTEHNVYVRKAALDFFYYPPLNFLVLQSLDFGEQVYAYSLCSNSLLKTNHDICSKS